jgi:hypothetical protein
MGNPFAAIICALAASPVPTVDYPTAKMFGLGEREDARYHLGWSSPSYPPSPQPKPKREGYPVARVDGFTARESLGHRGRKPSKRRR